MHNFISVVNVTLQIQTRYDGNSIDDGPAPPSTESTSPPPREPDKSNPHSGSGSHPKRHGSDDKKSDDHKGTSPGAIVGIVLGSVLVSSVVLVAIVFCIRKLKGKEKGARTSNGSLPPGIINGEFFFSSFLFPNILYDYVILFLCQTYYNMEYTLIWSNLCALTSLAFLVGLYSQ